MTHLSADQAVNEKVRENWIDTIRATACMMVIMLHVAAYYVTRSSVNSDYWNFANIIDSATRSCVPLFFMISGYLFLGSRAPKFRHILRVVSSIAVYSAVAVVTLWVVTSPRTKDPGLQFS